MKDSICRAHVLDTDPLVTGWLNQHPYILATDDNEVDELDLADYDMIVFTGGSDVHPKFYGEKPLEGCGWYDIERDLRELEIFERTRTTHYHFGICRGMQLLAVAQGYKLWQDVSGHNLLTGTHGLKQTKHSPWKGRHLDTGCTSAHHQAVKLPEGKQSGVLLAFESYGPGALVQAKANGTVTRFLKKIPEAMWWPVTNSFGVQGHPEYPKASEEYCEYVMDVMLDDDVTGYYNALFDTFTG